MKISSIHIESAAQALDIRVSQDQIDQFIQLISFLVKWNKAYNLTAIRDPEEMLVRHIFDSLAIFPYITGKLVLDVGTGPGFPGLPLAIVYPDHEFVLLDSNGKKTRFIKQAIVELGLENVTVVQERIERYQPGQLVDIVVSRAFADLEDMVNCCHHCLAPNGTLLAMKGRYPEDELARVKAKTSVHTLEVPDLDEARHLVCIKRQDIG